MATPTKITIGNHTYSVKPKYVQKSKGKATTKRPPSGHIFIQKNDWKVPSPFKFPNPHYEVSGTEEHPVLTSRVKPLLAQ